MRKEMALFPCGYEHGLNDDDDPCRHGQVVFDGFQFGDTVPKHKENPRYGPHVAEDCGWCLLHGNTQPLTRDTRRCKDCSLGDHGLCEQLPKCGCACVVMRKIPWDSMRR